MWSFRKIYLNSGLQNLFERKQGAIGNSSGESYMSDIVLLCNSVADTAPYAVSTEDYLSLKHGAISKVYDGCTWTRAIVLRNCNTAFVEMSY